MVCYNRSAEVTRSRLARLNRQSDNLKLRLKLPYANEGGLRELQEAVKAVLEPPASSAGGSAPCPSLTSAAGYSSGEPGSPLVSVADGSGGGGGPRGASPSPGSKPFSGHPVAPRSVDVVLSKFTDAGIELLVKAKLRADPSSAAVQALLLELSRRVRALGASMTNV
jgi:hypothetical protein